MLMGSYSWGIELLRGSNKLQEHEDLFRTSGIYSNVPLKKWASLLLLLFKRSKKSKQSFWYG